MTNFPIIEPEAIENLRSLNPDDNDEFLREIATIFLEGTPERIAELEDCLPAQDIERFTRAAHSIKGSSANLGALALRAAAEKLEQHALTNGMRDVGGMIDEIKTTFDQAKHELNRITGAA